MDVPTYQQLLAEQYEETAKNLLVFQKEYEEEDVDDREEYDYDKYELDNQEEFNRVQERHDLKNVIIPKKEFEDKSKLSIRYDKDIKTHIVDIDSRFRAYPKENYPIYTPLVPGGPLNTYPPSNVANFAFALPKSIKNAITLKITSISIPNVFYTFSAARENLSFKVYDENSSLKGIVTIKEGNYKAVIDITAEIQSHLSTIYPPTYPFKVDYDSTLNKIRFYRTDGVQFGLDFTPQTIKEPYNNGLGYNLGFEQFMYGTSPILIGSPAPVSLTLDSTSKFQALAETFPDIFGDSYVYLQINDYDVIEHQNFRQSFFPVFAKVMLPFNTKNQLVNDIDLLNVVQREYNFLQPTNIQKLNITIFDAYGNVIDMKGANFSFTLEIQEILNPALYEKLRDL